MAKPIRETESANVSVIICKVRMKKQENWTFLLKTSLYASEYLI